MLLWRSWGGSGGLEWFSEAVSYFVLKQGKGTCSSHCLSASLCLSLPICKMRLSLLMFGCCFEIPGSKKIITAIIVPSIIVVYWNWSQSKQGKWVQISPLTSVWTEHPQNIGLGLITSVAFAGKSQRNESVFFRWSEAEQWWILWNWIRLWVYLETSLIK